MAAEPAQLIAELKRLRKGRGLQSASIEGIIGPALREVCGVAAGDGPAAVRDRVTNHLAALADCLPPDLALIVRVALGLQSEVGGQFLHERVEWLARNQDRDTRTIRRRIDDGLTRLAEAATGPIERRPDDHQHGWHVQCFDAVLRLDAPTPTCFERRTIVADRDGLREITILYTIPPAAGAVTAQHGLHVEIHYGARLLSHTKISESLFRFVLALPETLDRGDEHEYCMIFRLPDDQPMRPHYLYVPERPCDRFELRVRFRHDRAPAAVERIDSAFHRSMDEATEAPELITVNGVGEALVIFEDLTPRLGYGLRWSLPDQG
jgi:hypothetical protein